MRATGVGAPRSLTNMARGIVIALALKELAEFFPAAREAKLEKAHVVKANPNPEAGGPDA